jgi:hypothetical protein
MGKRTLTGISTIDAEQSAIFDSLGVTNFPESNVIPEYTGTQVA